MLKLVERGEQFVEGLRVGGLAFGQPAAVDAVVDVVVDEGVDLVDVMPQRRRVEIERGVAEFVELRIQHADDLGRLVVDDRPCLAVPQHRHRCAARVAGLGGGVDLMDVECAVFRREVVEAARIGPALAFRQVAFEERDCRFESLQLAHQHGAVRPRAGRGGHQLIAPGLGLEAGRAVARHPIAEHRIRPQELPTAAGRRVVVEPGAVDQHAHAVSPLNL